MLFIQSAEVSLKSREVPAQNRLQTVPVPVQERNSSTAEQREGPEQSQSRSHSSRTVAATASVRSQKTSHWFLYYKFVK
jgi:hypothetical protein